MAEGLELEKQYLLFVALENKGLTGDMLFKPAGEAISFVHVTFENVPPLFEHHSVLRDPGVLWSL